jgi:hypothetical protein
MNNSPFAATDEEFAGLISTIESNGFFTSLHRHEDGAIDGLVCVSKKDDKGNLGGCSFWVSRSEGGWCVYSWDPKIVYLVPSRINIAALCLELLTVSQRALWEIPLNIVEKYDLAPVGT